MGRRRSDAKKLADYVHNLTGEKVLVKDIKGLIGRSDRTTGRRLTTQDILIVADHFKIDRDPALLEFERIPEGTVPGPVLRSLSDQELLDTLDAVSAEVRRRWESSQVKQVQSINTKAVGRERNVVTVSDKR